LLPDILPVTIMHADNQTGEIKKVIEVFPQIVANLRKLLPYWDNERNTLGADAPRLTQ
jgi:hypothetical protein